jgi:cell division inhibitor SulA
MVKDKYTVHIYSKSAVMNKLIDLLTHRHLVWQGNRQQASIETCPSGYADLDAQLAGGFPVQGVMELNTPTGIGELRLLLPHLATQQRLVVFIHPPAHINAHALLQAGLAAERVLIVEPSTPQEALWAAEWCAKSGACSSVLLWHQALAVHHVKRLQLAAEAGQSQVWLLRHEVHESLTLPWTLSMAFKAMPQGLEITVNKRKGGWSSRPFAMDFQAKWSDLITIPEHSAQVLAFETPQRMAK